MPAETATTDEHPSDIFGARVISDISFADELLVYIKNHNIQPTFVGPPGSKPEMIITRKSADLNIDDSKVTLEQPVQKLEEISTLINETEPEGEEAEEQKTTVTQKEKVMIGYPQVFTEEELHENILDAIARVMTDKNMGPIDVVRIDEEIRKQNAEILALEIEEEEVEEEKTYMQPVTYPEVFDEEEKDESILDTVQKFMDEKNIPSIDTPKLIAQIRQNEAEMMQQFNQAPVEEEPKKQREPIDDGLPTIETPSTVYTNEPTDDGEKLQDIYTNKKNRTDDILMDVFVVTGGTKEEYINLYGKKQQAQASPSQPPVQNTSQSKPPIQLPIPPEQVFQYFQQLLSQLSEHDCTSLQPVNLNNPVFLAQQLYPLLLHVKHTNKDQAFWTRIRQENNDLSAYLQKFLTNGMLFDESSIYMAKEFANRLVKFNPS